MESPGVGRMLTGHTLPGRLLCSQGPEGSPKTQPSLLMSYGIIYPPAPGLFNSPLEASGSHMPATMSLRTGSLAPMLLVHLVGVISFPESKGETHESAPLFSLFRKKPRTNPFLLCAQPSEGLSPPLPSLKTSCSIQRVLSCVFLGLSTSPCQPGPEPLQTENTVLLLMQKINVSIGVGTAMTSGAARSRRAEGFR